MREKIVVVPNTKLTKPREQTRNGSPFPSIALCIAMSAGRIIAVLAAQKIIVSLRHLMKIVMSQPAHKPIVKNYEEEKCTSQPHLNL